MCRESDAWRVLLAAIAVCGLAVLGAADAEAIVIIDGADLFPIPGSHYQSMNPVGFDITGDGSWDAEIVSMSLSGDMAGGGAISTPDTDGFFECDSFFDVFVEIDLPGLTGPVETVVRHSRADMSIGGLVSVGRTEMFDTEIVAMTLSGEVGGSPVILRESQALASAGGHSITDIGGGLYHIDSFFDVFTELSVDGGQNWIAAQPHPQYPEFPDGSIRMELNRLVPEPATMSLLALGGLGLLARRRRK